MALFKNMAITYKGMALYAKAQAGQEIHFTKMKVGGGQIGTQNPATLTQLIDPKLDVPITSITAKPELKSAIIVGNVTNKDVIEAMYICEIGLFATDPDEGEILYGYASCGTYGDYYPPATQGPFSWQYEIGAAIGNAANVTAELSVLQWDSDIKNSNTAFIKISGGNQKEINKSIDNYLNSLTNKIENIKVPVTKVNNKTGDIVLKAEDINCNDNKSVESHLEENKKQIDEKLPQIDFDNFRKDYVSNNGFAKTTGTSTIYNVILDPAPISYVDGLNVTIIPHVDCGDNPKINLNGLGVTTILKQDGTDIKDGEIKANKPLSLVRVGSNFFIKNSGGSGLQIKEIREIKGTILQNQEMISINVGEYDVKKTVFTISAYSEYAYQDFSSLLVFPKNNTTIEISHQTRSVAGVSVNFTIRMYVLDGIKKIHSISHIINPNDTNVITIASNMNTQKCLVFKTFKTRHNSDFTGMSLFQEEIYNEGNIGKMKITTSGYSQEKSQYVYIIYQIVELN